MYGGFAFFLRLLVLLIGPAPKLLALNWLSARALHLHFVSVLKGTTDFELFKTRIASEFDF